LPYKNNNCKYIRSGQRKNHFCFVFLLIITQIKFAFPLDRIADTVYIVLNILLLFKGIQRRKKGAKAKQSKAKQANQQFYYY